LLLLNETEFYKNLEDAVIDEKYMVYNMGVKKSFSKGSLVDFSKIFLGGKMVIAYLVFPTGN